MKKDNSNKTLLKKAAQAFMNGEFKKAMFYYSSVLKNEPDNKEAKIGIILSDIASEGNIEAQEIFDYYIALKEENDENSEKVIEDFIESIDRDSDFIPNIATINMYDMEDAILYSDFKQLVKSRGDFKQAFEDIMFSTKVIINKKDDFLNFLNDLIDNGFEEMALSYLEDAAKLYRADPKIYRLFEKLDSSKHLKWL